MSAKPPPLRLWANELPGFAKVIGAPLRRPRRIEAFGKGRPIMVLPGLLGGDGSTAFLRANLEAAGFAAHGWGEGFNLRATPETVAKVEDRLLALQGKSGQKVILIGWSLGGIYARLLAHRRPKSVALVMTLGSPFSGDRRANNAWRLYERLNDHPVDAAPFEEDVSAKPPVPTIAMWSPVDGIVAPECARGLPDQSDRQVELPYRHVELGASRRAIEAVLQVLRESLEGSGAN